MTDWIKRKKTNEINVGSVKVGGDNPISIQSMTNTDTCNVEATIGQINDLKLAGADIVRVSVPTFDAADAFKKIKKQVEIPLVADIHFDYKIALEVASTADCLRINPGNIGKEQRIREVINAAKDNNVPIRVGVNAGSLEKDLQVKYGEPNSSALVESAMRHVEILDRFNFTNYKMSLKASNIEMTVDAYREISTKIEQPLHLGITEAGSFRSGTVKSSIGVGMLLSEGIKNVQTYIQNELDDWSKWGVEGHEKAKNPWLDYHEIFNDKISPIVGAKNKELVVTHSLTTNLHLLLISLIGINISYLEMVVLQLLFKKIVLQIKVLKY